MKSLYNLLFGLLFISAFSQNQTPLYQINSNNVIIDNTIVEIPSAIKINETTVEYIQLNTNGQTSDVFEITETNGQWDSQTFTGKITYTLVQEGYQAIFKLTGTETGIIAQFNFILNSTEQEIYLFNVDSISYQ